MTTSVSSEAKRRPQALYFNADGTAYRSPLSRGRQLLSLPGLDPEINLVRKTFLILLDGGVKPAHDGASEKTYAWPSVSNIAAFMASVALLPAQTTNWNAG